jgi:hypothetical protein
MGKTENKATRTYGRMREDLEGSTMNARSILFAIAGGVLVALATGLFSNTPSMLVGAVHYGYPLPWLIRMIVAPEYFPWVVNYVNLIVDIVVWAIIVGVLLLILARTRKSSR